MILPAFVALFVSEGQDHCALFERLRDGGFGKGCS